MDLLNNLNIIVGLIIGLGTIGSSVWGVSKYFRSKATSAQKRQTMQLSSTSKQFVRQTMSKPLSRLDWMEVLWNGLEDGVKAKDGNGVVASVTIGFLGLIAMGLFSAPIIVFIAFFTLFISVNLLFYAYFVGRRIEKKVEAINGSLVQKTNNTRGH